MKNMGLKLTYLIMCTHKMATWNILDDNRLSLLHYIPSSPSSTTPSTLHVAQMDVSPIVPAVVYYNKGPADYQVI